jgi:hypothetical protein
LVFGGGEWVCEDGKSVYQLPVFLWSFEEKKLMGWGKCNKSSSKTREGHLEQFLFFPSDNNQILFSFW